MKRFVYGMVFLILLVAGLNGGTALWAAPGHPAGTVPTRTPTPGPANTPASAPTATPQSVATRTPTRTLTHTPTPSGASAADTSTPAPSTASDTPQPPADAPTNEPPAATADVRIQGTPVVEQPTRPGPAAVEAVPVPTVTDASTEAADAVVTKIATLEPPSTSSTNPTRQRTSKPILSKATVLSSPTADPVAGGGLSLSPLLLGGVCLLAVGAVVVVRTGRRKK